MTETKPTIMKLEPGQFVEPDPAKLKAIGKKYFDELRQAHQRLAETLSTVQIDDPDSQQSLLDQAESAVRRFIKEKGKASPNFKPFAFFTEPKGDRFLVGDIEGTWGNDGSFQLKGVLIHHVRSTPAEMRSLLSVIQHLNPGVPKVASDSFLEALNALSQPPSRR